MEVGRGRTLAHAQPRSLAVRVCDDHLHVVAFEMPLHRALAPTMWTLINSVPALNLQRCNVEPYLSMADKTATLVIQSTPTRWLYETWLCVTERGENLYGAFEFWVIPPEAKVWYYVDTYSITWLLWILKSAL